MKTHQPRRSLAVTANSARLVQARIQDPQFADLCQRRLVRGGPGDG